MHTTLILNQLQYKQWADGRTIAAVEQIDAHRFPSELAFARQQLNHMLRVEEVFRARLQGTEEPHTESNSELLPTTAELSERLSESNRWLKIYFGAMPDVALREKMHFSFLDGKRGTMARVEVLFHLINHGTYHRGAIGRALDIAGGLRPADTYTVYIHAAEPQRRNES
ncbi:damage-inducible protein DinB [Pseudoduganella sp. FT93W]|uniref:Damage-inducible protein DinB n=1 Tax=Duganella fentianensis TaxID=2692177 RepID=A0A845HTE7_9BURK|nr:DinB family protein [Duganella fentianensis]MYN44714.1 damage-inducible protein DinB [Duganella fentianensis]